MILETSVDRYIIFLTCCFGLSNRKIPVHPQAESPLRGGLQACGGPELRCNVLKENSYSATLRLALNHRKGTLHHAQLRFPG